MLQTPIVGAPGVSDTIQANYRRAYFGPMTDTYLAGGKSVDGSKARDPGNGDITVLRAGILLGKITASGMLAPAFIGLTGTAITSAGTTVTVPEAVGNEIERRIGATGSLTFIGPPTAAGVVASDTTTYSAIAAPSGGNRVITIAATGTDFVAGSLIATTDGSGNPITYIPDGWGWQMVNAQGDNIYFQGARVPIQGLTDFNQLLPAVTDTSLQAWIKARLRDSGNFVFSGTGGDF